MQETVVHPTTSPSSIQPTFPRARDAVYEWVIEQNPGPWSIKQFEELAAVQWSKVEPRLMELFDDPHSAEESTRARYHQKIWTLMILADNPILCCV